MYILYKLMYINKAVMHVFDIVVWNYQLATYNTFFMVWRKGYIIIIIKSPSFIISQCPCVTTKPMYVCYLEEGISHSSSSSSSHHPSLSATAPVSPRSRCMYVIWKKGYIIIIIKSPSFLISHCSCVPTKPMYVCHLKEGIHHHHHQVTILPYQPVPLCPHEADVCMSFGRRDTSSSSSSHHPSLSASAPVSPRSRCMYVIWKKGYIIIIIKSPSFLISQCPCVPTKPMYVCHLEEGIHHHHHQVTILPYQPVPLCPHEADVCMLFGRRDTSSSSSSHHPSLSASAPVSPRSRCMYVIWRKG